jgi:nucleoside-diphosphate-sugar epimerase
MQRRFLNANNEDGVCSEADYAYYIVTGGAGFIGSALVRSLRLKFPDRRVVVVDNLSRGRLRNLYPLHEHFSTTGEPVLNLATDVKVVDLSD